MARSSPPPPDANGRGNSGGGTPGSTADRPLTMTGWQRLSQTFVRPPLPETTGKEPDYSRMSDDEKRVRIVTLDPFERKLGLGAAALSVVLGLVFTVPYMIKKTAVTTTTKPVGKHCPAGLTYVTHGTSAATCRGVLPVSHYLTYLVVYLVLAILIYLTVRFRRRSGVAFSTAITGVALGALAIVPFLVVSGWILLRSYRTQKYGAPTARSPRPGYTPPVGRSSSRRRPPAKRGGTTAAPTRKAPEASKRYTPKAPPKPAKKGTPPSR